MLQGLLDSPEQFVMHIRRYTTSLTTQMTFGFRTISNTDPKMLAQMKVRQNALLVCEELKRNADVYTRYLTISP